MERLKEVLAVVNNKGGVGKTTTVQSLAAALVRMDKKLRVLVIDLDPQMHLSILHGWNQADDYFTTPTIYTAMRNGSSLPVYRTTRDGVYMVPGDDTLQDVDSDLIRQMNPKRVLQKCFGLPIDDHTDRECPKGEKVQPSVGSWKECEKEGLTTIIESFDYVLIDCAPALSQSTYNAMTVASGLLIPVQMEGLRRGLLPTMVDARPKIVRDFIDYLQRSYGDFVCKTMIHRSVKMNEAQTLKKDIYGYRFGQWSKVANDYEKLTEELFNC